jgi:hypothetical protein
MNSYNYSYNVLINRLEAFAAGHLLIKRFTHGQIDLADMDQNEQYPFMHVVPNNIKPVEGGMQFDFQILFADIPRDKETKAEYQREVISDCVRLAQDLIAEVKNGLILFGFDVQLVTPPVIEPFVEEYKNTLTGVSFSLQLEVPWDWSACDIPAVWSVGGTSSGGTGNAYGITLKTNGVNNAVQNILDLVAGTNVTITDNGDGSVTFDAVGGGATVLVSTEFNVNHTTATGNQYVVGDRVWYNGNVYACIANNDALLPTNTLYWTLQGAGFRLRQSPVDWNASSGDYQILNKPNIPSAQGLQDVITTNATLTTDNTIDCATFGLTIFDTSNFEVNSTNKVNLDVNGTAEIGVDTNSVSLQKATGTVQTQVIVDTTKAAIGATDSSTSNTTQFSLLPNEVRLVTPNVNDSVATVGQVLTLSNAGTGEVEFTTVGGGGTVTSVALTTPAAFSVTGSPITTSGTLAITAAGIAAQYIDGSGALQTFPTIPTGTVTSVAALTIGTSGSDLASTVANGTTTPVITLNVPTASAANRGALSSADWTTFNGKQNNIGLTTVGTNLATLPNPSDVRYLRINADNTVSALTLAQLKTDLSLGSDITVVAGSNVVTVGTTFEDVTGLSFAVTANKTYKWRATISFGATSGTYLFSSNGPTTSINNARFTMTTGATTNGVSNQVTYDAGTNVTGSSNGLTTADGILRVTASGTFVIRFRSSIAGALTVRAGSVLEYSEVL